MKKVALLGLLILALFVPAVPASAETIDPVFFCDNPASENCSGDPNIITSATEFGMYKNGTGTSTDPWYLLVAIPDYAGSAPTITSDGGIFTIQSPSSSYTLTSGDVYSLTGTSGPNSMSFVNMSGFDATLLGTAPSSFEVFVYTVTPGFDSNVAYSFSVSGSGLPTGTFLAASGDKMPFATPFTTAGVVNAPDGGLTVMLLGGALVGLGSLRRRFRG